MQPAIKIKIIHQPRIFDISVGKRGNFRNKARKKGVKTAIPNRFPIQKVSKV